MLLVCTKVWSSIFSYLPTSRSVADCKTVMRKEDFAVSQISLFSKCNQAMVTLTTLSFPAERREQQQAADNNTSPRPGPITGQSRVNHSPAFRLDSPTLNQSGTSYLTSPKLNEGNFWDIQIRESLLNGTDAPESISINENSSSLIDLNSSLSAAKTTPDSIVRYNGEIQARDSTAGENQSLQAQSTNILPQFQLPTPPSRGACSSEWLGALHIAAQKGHDRIVRVLLQQNMDCNEKDSDGRTPLMYAVIENHETVVSALIFHGARSNVVDNSRRSVLHLAVLYRRENVLRDLLEACPGRRQELDIDAYDASGKTPLHLAVEEGFELGVIILLRNGANTNVKARKSPI